MTSTLSQSLQKIASHPRGSDLARLTRDCLFASVDSQNLDLSTCVAEKANASNLSHEEAKLEDADILGALSSPRNHPGASTVLGRLLAYALALDPPESYEITAKKFVWITTHAGIDALGAIDAASGETAANLWNALADRLQEQDRQANDLTEAIVIASSLAASNNDTARKRRDELASSLQSPVIQRLLQSNLGSAVPLSGELVPPPRGPWATFFLGLTGWLFLSHLVRLIGRFALQYRRPAEVRITSKGIQVRSTTKLLGKVMKESETLIPIGGLARATREVRFPRLGTYTGLVALAVGSYIGVSWFIDGVRSGSFSLATVGLLIILGGVALDFVLVSLLPGRKGRCRVVFVPRKGTATCVGLVDSTKADVLLKRLSQNG